MNQREIEIDWCRRVATEIVDELIYGKLLAPKDTELANKIIYGEIELFLVAGDLPLPDSRRYPTEQP
jgi:hypothetical protein